MEIEFALEVSLLGPVRLLWMLLHVSHVGQLEALGSCQVHGLHFLLPPVFACILKHLIVLLFAFLADPTCCDGSWNLVLLCLGKIELLGIWATVVDNKLRVY